jgi:crotonobetainyl-CoA:carnitine CoA-transferase CaiB-like acyl-CoA transferase
MAGPLEGIKVVEIGVWIAGPAAGLVLADWGADVIKIEPPGLGDPGRLFQKMIGGDLPFNPPFEMDNRNKRSVVLDLRSEEGIALALELIDGADVFLSNLRAGALERLGLDSDTLLARNPRLIYASITGYGLDGPDKDRAAYDIAAFWARSGLAGALKQTGRPPPHQRGGMGDHGAGMVAAGAVCAALYSREKTGRGQKLATSLLRQGLYTLSFDLAIYLRFGVAVLAGDRDTMPNPLINCYQDSEGAWFWIVGLEAERHWAPLARAIGRPQWVDDERFQSVGARAQNATVLIPLLDEIFASRTRQEWGAVFDTEEDVWWAPVQTIEDVVADPQVAAAGGFVEVPDAQGTTLLPATPADFFGTPIQQRCMAPEHGQHSDEILRELGRSEGQIKALREAGVLGSSGGV